MQLCYLGCFLNTENGGSVTAGCTAPSVYALPNFPFSSLHVSVHVGLLEGVRYIYHRDKARATCSKEKIKLPLCKITTRARYAANIGRENCDMCISFTYKTHFLVPVCRMKIFKISMHQLLSFSPSLLLVPIFLIHWEKKFNLLFKLHWTKYDWGGLNKSTRTGVFLELCCSLHGSSDFGSAVSEGATPSSLLSSQVWPCGQSSV